MNPLKKIGDFLFGKNPDIFDENGRVFHRYPRKTWDAWRARFEHNADYNWRKHSGTTLGEDEPSRPEKNSDQRP